MFAIALHLWDKNYHSYNLQFLGHQPVTNSTMPRVMEEGIWFGEILLHNYHYFNGLSL